MDLMKLREIIHIMLSMMLFAAILPCMVLKTNNVFYGKKARRILRNISVLVVRWTGKEFKNSRPCKHCCGLLKKLGIKNIIYSDDSGNLVSERASRIKSDHLSFARRAGFA
jgi:hypothetical protein